MNREGASGQAGFTLLELLVAITILSLILVAVSEGVQFAGSSWRKQSEQIARQDDVSAVQTALRQLLASGRNFAGNSQHLRFLAPMPAALARGGLYEIELGQDGQALRLSWKPHLAGITTGLRRDDTVLLEGVESLGLSYHLAQGGWQPAVAAETKAADIIAIKARLSRGRLWPSLMISPVINASLKPQP